MRLTAVFSIVVACCTAEPDCTIVARPRADGSVRVLFGSCSRTGLKQPLWTPIIARQADAFCWGGDAIYSDRRYLSGWEPGNPQALRLMYEQQRRLPGYAALLRSRTPVVGTWDDHDYGLNDGDRTFKWRAESQQEYLRFLGVDAADARRTERRGVYAYHDIVRPAGAGQGGGGGGGEGERVRLVLLDIRYHRDPYSSLCGGAGDMLGAAQWGWLENEAFVDSADEPVSLFVVVSGLQVLPLGRCKLENWARFPSARRRLLASLHRLNARPGSAAIVVSGDVHFGELSAEVCGGDGGVAGGVDGGRGVDRGADGGANRAHANATELLELTTSGMTHSWLHNESGFKLKVSPRFPGCEFFMYSVLFILKLKLPWLKWTVPTFFARRAISAFMWAMPHNHQLAWQGQLNFGEVSVRWPPELGSGVEVTASVRDVSGAAVLSRTIRSKPPTSGNSGADSGGGGAAGAAETTQDVSCLPVNGSTETAAWRLSWWMGVLALGAVVLAWLLPLLLLALLLALLWWRRRGRGEAKSGVKAE